VRDRGAMPISMCSVVAGTGRAQGALLQHRGRARLWEPWRGM